jgi:hypothetical protein
MCVNVCMHRNLDKITENNNGMLFNRFEDRTAGDIQTRNMSYMTGFRNFPIILAALGITSLGRQSGQREWLGEIYNWFLFGPQSSRITQACGLSPVRD